MANYDNFMKTIAGFNLTSSDTPLDGRMVVKLDEDIKLVPFPYVGQIIYSHESKRFFVVKSLKDGWQDIKTGEFFDEDPQRPVEEVRMKKNSLVNEFEPINKVDKEEGKSLIADSEIERLLTLKNYDDAELRAAIEELVNSKVDKVEGKSLVDDAEIARLAQVDNYDDSELRELIDTKIADLVDGAPEALDTLKELGDALNAHEDAYNSLLEVVGNKADANHVHDQYLTEHQDISGKVDKVDGKSLIDDVEIERLAQVDNYDDSELRAAVEAKVDKEEGKSLISDTEMARLALVDNYDDSELRGLVDGKANVDHVHNQYLTEHQDISGKVDKEEGKSLVDDAEIARLAQVDNYDDSELRGLIDGKADADHAHDQYLTEHQDISGKVDKVEGKSLVDDTEIARLALVDNYNDSEVKERINVLETINLETKPYIDKNGALILCGCPAVARPNTGKLLDPEANETDIIVSVRYYKKALDKFVFTADQFATLRIHMGYGDEGIGSKRNISETTLELYDIDRVGVIFGGSQITGEIGTVNIIVERCNTISSLLCAYCTEGGAKNVTHNFNLKVKDCGSVSSIFGGTNGYGVVWNSHVEVENTNVGYLVAGGSNGFTRKSEVVLNGGNVAVMQGVNRGILEEAKLIVNGGNVEKFYAAGDTEDNTVTGIQYKAIVELNGGTIQNFFNGNSNSLPFDSSNIEGTISPNCTVLNGDTSMLEVKQPEPNEIEELRVALDTKVDKVDGKSLVDDAEIARLSQVHNYDDSELRGLIDGKANADHVHNQYLTEHQDISGKVDKVDGKSLVDDAEIARLAQVDNYDDSELRGLIDTKIANLVDGAPEALDTLKELGDALNAHEGAYEALLEVVGKKADAEHVHDQYLTEHQDISGKVDKEDGKSLVANSEIERLAQVDNYDDSELRGLINGKADADHVHEQYLTEHQDISGKVDKEEGKSLVDDLEIERLASVHNYDDAELKTLIYAKADKEHSHEQYITVQNLDAKVDKEDGKSLVANSEIERLAQVDNYDDSELRGLINGKADADHVHDQYLTEHQDISGKVDKEEGKSLISDLEIERLASVHNYDDSELRGLIDGKADVNHIHDQYLTEHQDISGKVDKVEGKSLVDDVEIERLAQVYNYNDSEVKERINVLETINLETKPYIDKNGALILCGCPAVARPNTGKLLDPEANETDIVVSVRYYKKALDKFVFTADQFSTLRIHMGYGDEGIGSKRNISETTLELYDIDRAGVIFGGSKITGEIGTVNIIVERCNAISSILCAYCTEGGAKNVTHNFNLKVKDCRSVSSIFGGTNGYGVVWNSHVEVENTNVGYLVAGGSNGFTRKSEVILNGGNIEVMQGVNRGILEEAKLVVNSGNVINFYAAGDTEDSTVTGIQYKAIVELNGGTIQNFFNGNSNSLPFDSSNIEGTISPDCTVLNGDISMLVEKQPEPNEIEELRVALETKVDKENGKSLISDDEMARLALVDNYDDSELRGLIDGKADTDHVHEQYLTKHQDISGKVDKVDGKSLVSDVEIARLALVDNYDDSELRGLVDSKADVNHVHNQYLTEHQDISGKVDKVEGKSLVDDAEIARLALVDNYDDSELRELIDTKIAGLVDGAPEALDTLRELGEALSAHENAYDALLESVGKKADADHVHDQYLTEHQDISGKVDKVEGKSLVDDAEIARLALVDNYDDSELRGLINGKANADHIHNQYLTEHQDISGKVDKVEGKSLVADAEIERLASVYNYDDSELRAAVEAKVDKADGKSLVDDVEIERLAKVDNYDDSELRGLINGKANVDHVHNQYLTEHQDISGKVDKVEGKSLISDVEMARLALVDNYDDSELRGLVNGKADTDHVHEQYLTEHQDISGKVDKVDGKSLVSDVEIARLAQVNNYDDSELRGLIDGKANADHVHNQYLTEHQDISGKVDKVEGKSLISDTEIERLASVDNYDDSELRGLINGKANADHVHDQYLTEHQDISGKVDKEEGKSLISDTEMARLALVDNYDDSELRGLINGKANADHVHDQYLTEHQDISGKVDKVEGKSLVADTEIARLAQVDNYDDTNVKERINVLETINLETKPYVDKNGMLVLCGCPAVARPNTGKLLDSEANETDVVVSVRFYQNALDKFVFTADQFAKLRICMGYGAEGVGTKRNIAETTLELYDLDRVYIIDGGSQITGEIGTVNIIAERCNYIDGIQGARGMNGGERNIVHNFNVKVKDCRSIDTLFGGANGYAVVWNSHVEVENTNVRCLVAGGSNGFVRKSEVVLNGGNITVMQGVNRGILEEAKLIVNSGNVTNFYAAGDTQDNSVTGTQYKAIVELNGGTIQNFFNGNSNSLPFNSSNIEGTISPDCTVSNGDISMLVVKQPEAQAPSFAFNENGELVVTINGVSKTFVPKSE